MSTRATRLLRIVAAGLIGLGQCAPPLAEAVSPPPIDDTRLPEPAPPAPPQPTVQRAVCTVPAFAPQRRDTSGQLDTLDLHQVWRLARGQGQRVAVIDTGVSPHHRLPHLVAGGDYVFTGDGTQDCDGHGTAVAGIIAAAADSNAADEFAGVAPEATLIGIRQSSTKFGPVGDPSVTGVGDVNTMARAVRTAADLGATVINVSAVACAPADAGLDDRALGAALAYAVDVKDAVVVAAAGNAGGPCPAQRAETTWDSTTVAVSPAWYDEYVLTVGSVTGDGAPSAFTLAGPWLDVAAPGEAVLSLSPVGDALVNALGGQGGHGDDAPIAGTSYAAPVVSGLAALVRSRFPALTARQVMARIKATAHHPPGGWNPVVGSGVVDALAAVSTAAPSDAAAPPSSTPPAPVSPPPATDRRPHDTAISGAGLCLVVVLLGLMGARLRRSTAPGHVAGD